MYDPGSLCYAWPHRTSDLPFPANPGVLDGQLFYYLLLLVIQCAVVRGENQKMYMVCQHNPKKT